VLDDVPAHELAKAHISTSSFRNSYAALCGEGNASRLACVHSAMCSPPYPQCSKNALITRHGHGGPSRPPACWQRGGDLVERGQRV
jgi:hypothetical protein